MSGLSCLHLLTLQNTAYYMQSGGVLFQIDSMCLVVVECVGAWGYLHILHYKPYFFPHSSHHSILGVLACSIGHLTISCLLFVTSFRVSESVTMFPHDLSIPFTTFPCLPTL